jgi:hypothetical protein
LLQIFGKSGDNPSRRKLGLVVFSRLICEGKPMSVNLEKVNAAVRDCLDQCYPSRQPLATLAAYLIKLSTNPDWRQDEIDAVEAGVVRMLALLSSPSDSGIIPAGVLKPSEQSS